MIALSLWTWQNQSRSSRQAINMVHIWSVPKFQNKEDRALILQGWGQLWEPSRMRYGVMGRFIQGREERKRSWAPPSGNCCICGLLLVSNVKVLDESAFSPCECKYFLLKLKCMQLCRWFRLLNIWQGQSWHKKNCIRFAYELVQHQNWVKI